MNILEEFWYGNIEPAEYDISSSKEYKELLQLISWNEDKLLATMTDEQKELFTKYSENLLHRFSSFCFTTYTRTAGFCLKDKPNFQRVARQNPSVLRSPESACSPTEQPLSAERGHKRSNTLDFIP